MSDIVERLREIVANMDRVWADAGCDPAPCSPLIEAADEITRLRVEVESLKHRLSCYRFALEVYAPDILDDIDDELGEEA